MVAMKYVSLVLLTLQNCSQMLIMRYSLTQRNYIASTAVVMQETVKLCLSLMFMVLVDGQSPAQVLDTLRDKVLNNRSQMAKMAVPGVLYLIQNNLLYIAMSNLDAATCSILYQLKIVTAAMFSVVILGKKIGMTKWIALVVLFCGAACVQYSKTLAAPPDPTETKVIREQSPMVGLAAVVAACLLSGCAGVYLELMLKSVKSTSLWLKNVQLALFGITFGLAGVFVKDWDAVMENGFFHGYSGVVWVVILDVSCGGLLVALVVKYADAIMKGFATSVSIVLSTVISVMFMGFQLTSYFLLGAILVVVATVMYSQPQPPQPAKESAALPERSVPMTSLNK